MSICERCGKEMPANASVCPYCGTASSISRSGMGVPKEYEQPPSTYSSSTYDQGYAAQPQGYEQPSSTYSSPAYSQGYGQQPLYPPSQPVYSQQQMYSAPPVGYPPVSVNVTIGAPVAPVVSSGGNTGAMVAEILLNLFLGIYGVGWLMAGETTTGIILLICSFFLYWPIMVLGAVFTLGLGLLCLGPLAIGGIILNAILLNNTIKRKTSYVLLQQVQPVQTIPPR